MNIADLAPIVSSTLFGDQIRLPSSILAHISAQDHTYPLTFRLTFANNHYYAGVREFTAQANTVQIPLLVSHHLFGSTLDARNNNNVADTRINTTSSSKNKHTDSMPTGIAQNEYHNPEQSNDAMESKVNSSDNMQSADCNIEEMNNYFLCANISIQVQLVTLKKGVFAHLKPLDSSYLAIPDMRAYLEAHLRTKYTTLTRFTHLHIEFIANSLVQKCIFIVTKLEPNDEKETGVLCINTDIEVEIGTDDMRIQNDSMLIKYDLQSDNQLGPRMCSWIDTLNNSQFTSSITLNIDSRNQAKVRYAIPIKTPNEPNHIKISKQSDSGDIDWFASVRTEYPSRLLHDWFNVDHCNGITYLSVSGSPFLYLTVASGSSEPEFRGSIKIEYSKTEFAAMTTDPNNLQIQESSVDYDPILFVLCVNCTKHVPTSTYARHQAFCERNNIVCKTCRLVVSKNDVDAHTHCIQCIFVGSSASLKKHEMVHARLSCTCGQEMELGDVGKHQEYCVDRLIVCRFCHILVRAGILSRTAKDLYAGTKLTEHESECGSRTITCSKCTKQIQLKDVGAHHQMHDRQRQMQTTPVVCGNVNCGALVGTTVNRMCVCAACYSPFWTSRVDVGDVKLAQKIGGQYHVNLIKGCGSTMCDNKVFIVADQVLCE